MACLYAQEFPGNIFRASFQPKVSLLYCATRKTVSQRNIFLNLCRQSYSFSSIKRSQCPPARLAQQLGSRLSPLCSAAEGLTLQEYAAHVDLHLFNVRAMVQNIRITFFFISAHSHILNFSKEQQITNVVKN